MAMLSHFAAFLVTLFLIVIISHGNAITLIALMLMQAMVLYGFRRIYKTSLRCDSCGYILKHRDIFDIGGNRK